MGALVGSFEQTLERRYGSVVRERYLHQFFVGLHQP
jgi:hypothetical protein